MRMNVEKPLLTIVFSLAISSFKSPLTIEKQFAVTTAVDPESQVAKTILDSMGSTFSEIQDFLESERNST